MASRSFPGSARFHRSGDWDLFQARTDREWFSLPRRDGSCSVGLTIDVNVQNVNRAGSIGFWNLDGPFAVSEQRTRDVFSSRRFSCDGDARVRRTSQSSPTDLTSKYSCKRIRNQRRAEQLTAIEYSNPARIGNESGSLVEIDVDDDGTMDGWTWIGNLTPDFESKPDWIPATRDREEAVCQ